MALPASQRTVTLVQGLSESLRAGHCHQEGGLHDELGDEGCQCHLSHKKLGVRSLLQTWSHWKDRDSMPAEGNHQATNTGPRRGPHSCSASFRQTQAIVPGFRSAVPGSQDRSTGVCPELPGGKEGEAFQALGTALSKATEL